MAEENNSHQMGRRGYRKDYCLPGIYHVTINVKERQQQPLGRVVGNPDKADGDADAPRVVLTDIGRMVEQELTTSITAHYPVIEVQDYVIMPEHLHFIVVVHNSIVSSHGRLTHLGQVIAGFKKGCNRRYWELTGQEGGADAWQGKPANASGAGLQQGGAGLLQGKPADASGAGLQQGGASLLQGKPANASGAGLLQGKPADASGAAVSRSAVYPHGYKVPSSGSSGRPPLFEHGYVDVMPLEEGQLERQREYIRNNPRSRLLRTLNRAWLRPQRSSIATHVSLPALKGYLQRECRPSQFSDSTWAWLQPRLHVATGMVVCDSYGNGELIQRRLLPVVCHQKDKPLHPLQKQRCLAAAAEGAVLVSPRIAKGEQDIMDAATAIGYPVIIIEDNGLPELYHPSERRMGLCAESRLLIVTPWLFVYRHASEAISVSECKTMNCIAQALCRTKDSWWK